MSKALLGGAIAETVIDRLKKTSDQILRIDSSRDWPIREALELVGKSIDLRVLVRRPFDEASVANTTAKVTANPGVATRWRNEHPRRFAVLIVGGTTGNLDAGLKDVKKIARSDFVEAWRRKVLASISRGDTELSKDEAQRLLNGLFGDVADGVIRASELEEYLEQIQDKPKVSEICGGLWRVGLMPDDQAINKGQSLKRLRRNRELVDLIKTSDDSRVDRLLVKAAKDKDAAKARVAKAAIRLRAKAEVAPLKEMELDVVEKIFQSVPSTPVARAINLFALLDHHSIHPDETKRVLEAISSSWSMSEPVPVLECEFKTPEERLTVKVELKPTTTEDSEDGSSVDAPWVGATDHDSILAAASTKEDPEGLASDQKYFRPADLREFHLATEDVESYLAARRRLLAYEPWLENDAVPLLLLKPEATRAASDFVSAWAALAATTRDLDDRPGFVEAVQVLETVQGPTKTCSWIVLGPLHPFRLDPIIRAATQVQQRLVGSPIPLLGNAFAWTLDRCYPSYPTIHLKDQTFSANSTQPLVVYRREAGQHLPPVRESNGLDRVLKAIEGFSPWMGDGLSILAVDPPQGGGVSDALENARRRGAERTVVVHHLATCDEADSLDNFEGRLNFIPRAKRLADAKELPPVNVMLRFVPEPESSGEAVSAGWQATRGAHLALEISDVIDGPFNGSGKTPKIKIDPRAGNIVVRRSQELYAKFKGGRPVLATFRPLLQTDEAPVLSSLATKTDWLVFAAPGPLGLVSPKTINSTLRFVGRSSMGRYGLYAYATDDLFPVRKHFEAFFRTTPVASVPPARMVDLLVARAQESGQAVLFCALGSVTAHLAAMVALQIAKDDLEQDEESFVLSLDDLGWTKAWLGEGRRADFILVKVSKAGRVTIRVIESKSQEDGQRTACDPGMEPYTEGIEQVRISLDAVKDIVTAVDPSLDQDLRFSSLIEQLMASVMVRAGELEPGVRKSVFEAVNALSKRELVPVFEGVCVLTQPAVNYRRQIKRVDNEVTIVWAGSPDVERTFGLDVVPKQATRVEVEPTEPSGPLWEQSGFEDGPVVDVTATSTEDEEHDATEGRVVSESPITELARGFIAATRIHGIAVDEPEPVYLQVGPSLFAVGVRLREGTAIQPLRSRLADIARDIGLGDRAHEIDLENDAEPRTVRVLLPRPDRQFPLLPQLNATVVSRDGYLPVFLGQTVDGQDFARSIESWPHMLVAGTTGSGKTTFIKSILKQLAVFGSGLLETVVVDGKGDPDYFGILPPAMFRKEFPDIQLGHATAIDVMTWALDEMERRRKVIVDLAQKSPSPEGVKAADLYRSAVANGLPLQVKPLILVIDEFADIMLASKKNAEQFEGLVQRVSQTGRSRLIHLVLATQRPDKETIRGAIKVNLNARAVFRLPTQADSFTVLGHGGAERLMLHGDMLFQSGTANPVRLQGYKV